MKPVFSLALLLSGVMLASSCVNHEVSPQSRSDKETTTAQKTPLPVEENLRMYKADIPAMAVAGKTLYIYVGEDQVTYDLVSSSTEPLYTPSSPSETNAPEVGGIRLPEPPPPCGNPRPTNLTCPLWEKSLELRKLAEKKSMTESVLFYYTYKHTETAVLTYTPKLPAELQEAFSYLPAGEAITAYPQH